MPSLQGSTDPCLPPVIAFARPSPNVVVAFFCACTSSASCQSCFEFLVSPSNVLQCCWSLAFQSFIHVAGQSWLPIHLSFVSLYITTPKVIANLAQKNTPHAPWASLLRTSSIQGGQMSFPCAELKLYMAALLCFGWGQPASRTWEMRGRLMCWYRYDIISCVRDL